MPAGPGGLGAATIASPPGAGKSATDGAGAAHAPPGQALTELWKTAPKCFKVAVPEHPGATGTRDSAAAHMTDQTTATVIRIKDFRRRRTLTCFSRQELNLLVSIYSRRVISGEWKAYALDHDDDGARFSIFTNAHAQPLYTIVKLAQPSRRRRRFTLTQGPRKIAEGDTLDQALAHFGRELRIISG